jgi:hypothetical protein
MPRIHNLHKNCHLYVEIDFYFCLIVRYPVCILCEWLLTKLIYRLRNYCNLWITLGLSVWLDCLLFGECLMNVRTGLGKVCTNGWKMLKIKWEVSFYHILCSIVRDLLNYDDLLLSCRYIAIYFGIKMLINFKIYFWKLAVSIIKLFLYYFWIKLFTIIFIILFFLHLQMIMIISFNYFNLVLGFIYFIYFIIFSFISYLS